MIEAFTKAWDERKHEIEIGFQQAHPESYYDIVVAVVKILGETDDWKNPDPERITVIDHGDYQGNFLFIIAADGYQPSDYWFVQVGYGSCSGCDTLADISSDGEYGEPPNEGQVKDYMTLALHILQGLKVVGGEVV
jgi:hypothetical protein